jgi:hypothetical protein
MAFRLLIAFMQVLFEQHNLALFYDTYSRRGILASSRMILLIQVVILDFSTGTAPRSSKTRPRLWATLKDDNKAVVHALPLSSMTVSGFASPSRTCGRAGTGFLGVSSRSDDVADKYI